MSTLLVRGLSGDSKPEGLFPSFRATTSRVPTYLAGPQLGPALTTHLLPAWLDCCVCDSHRWEWYPPCLHPFLPSRDPALLTSYVCSTLSLMDPWQRRPQPFAQGGVELKPVVLLVSLISFTPLHHPSVLEHEAPGWVCAASGEITLCMPLFPSGLWILPALRG